MLGNCGKKKRRGQKRKSRELQGFRGDTELGKWERVAAESSKRYHLCIGCG